jgi:hypothetical protein
MEMVDVILQNPKMKAEAELLLHGLWAREVIPFMNNYDAFVNATTDEGRGRAYAAIYQDHLRDGAEHFLNVYDGAIKELRASGPWKGPVPANAPLAGELQAALVEVKKLMYGALNVQVAADPHYRRAKDLLNLAAQPPAQTKAGRTSLSGKFAGLFTRQSSKKGSTPSSSGSSSSQANDAHQASGVSSSSRGRGGSISSRGGRTMSAIYGSGGTTPAKSTYTPRDITWDRLERPGSSALLDKCLANAEVRTLFGKFLAKERNHEGLLFLESCVLFFQGPTGPTLEKFRNLIANYVQPEAENQINIGVPARAAIAGAVSLDEARAAIELAENDIYRLLAHDPLRRFQNDPAFKDFLAKDGAGA